MRYPLPIGIELPDPVKTLTSKDLPVLLKAGEVFMLSEPQYLGPYDAATFDHQARIRDYHPDEDHNGWASVPETKHHVDSQVLERALEHIESCLKRRYGHDVFKVFLRTDVSRENIVTAELTSGEYREALVKNNQGNPIYAMVFLPFEIQTVTDLDIAGRELGVALWRRLRPELHRIAPARRRPLVTKQPEPEPRKNIPYSPKYCPQCGLTSCMHPRH